MMKIILKNYNRI